MKQMVMVLNTDRTEDGGEEGERDWIGADDEVDAGSMKEECAVAAKSPK